MIDTQKIFSFDCLDLKDAPTKFNAKWSVSPQLPYFEGHFPENPVLPAVALLDLSTELLNIILKKSVIFKSMSSAKFLTPVKPQDILSVELNSGKSSENWNCLFTNQDDILVGKLSFSLLQ